MAKKIELLLLKNIEHLGIVGDVVRVKMGYARNYLLPHGYAEAPSQRRIDSLEVERAEALAELAHLKETRVELLERMEDVQLPMTRSCNDQGVLYGSVTQRHMVLRRKRADRHRIEHQSLPSARWACSMLSKSARKLPAPKPSSPLRGRR